MASHPAAELGVFVRDLAAFVQWSETDAAAVRRSAPAVLRHQAELTGAVYEHFLAHPAAARFFLDADGAPDAARLERRKHSLGRWLTETAEASLRADGLYGVLGAGFAHSHRGQAPSEAVPPELMIGAMSLVQTALARILATELGDPQEALTASAAWNKLLLLQLTVLLHGYFMGWREGGVMAREVAVVHHSDRRTDVAMPYAPGIVVRRGSLVFLSGVTAAAVYHHHPHREEDFDLPATMSEQAALAMENLKKTLAGAGCTLRDVVAATRYLTDVAEQDDLNRVWAAYMGDHLPTTTTVEVSRLATHARCKVEITAIAVADGRP